MLVKNIINEGIEYYNMFYNNLYIKNNKSVEGGKQRRDSGEVVEHMSELFLRGACSILGITDNRIKILRGDKRSEGSVKVMSSNDPTAFIHAGVDKHLYIDDMLVGAEESKSYLDKCYLERAYTDCSYLKREIPNIITSVICIENSCCKSSFNFYMCDNNIDNITIMANGKRNSKTPIYLEKNFKSLEESYIKKHVEFWVESLRCYK